jgi:hypothetical protein
MFDNDKISFILERDTQINQESISRLTHDHCAKELATKPGTASGRNGSLDEGNLEIGASFAEHIRSAKTTRSGADDDNVGLSVCVEVIEVTASHGTADLRLSDGSKLEALLPVLGQFSESLGFGSIDGERLCVKCRFQRNAVSGSGLLEDCCGWCHLDGVLG